MDLHDRWTRSAGVLALAALVATGCESETTTLAPDAEVLEAHTPPPPGNANPRGVNYGDAAVYVANLKPLNASVTQESGAATGRATFIITEDGRFLANVDVKGVTPGEVHAQHIHAGERCPTPRADADGDGIIDVIEGVPSYGAILIPLDDTLEDQSQTFPPPMADERGRYNYSQSASLSGVLATLTDGSVPNPALFRDLNAGEELSLGTRHVVVHGGVVAGEGYRATLPVACGTITQVK